MKKTVKLIVVMSALFLVTGNAWALPMVGDIVNMGNDTTVPYTLTDKTINAVYGSFCLESQQDVYTNTDYYVKSVGDYAENGGGGYLVDGKDYLSDDTKWLYAAYMSNVFANESNAADKVQKAIWYLEEEVDGSEDMWGILKKYDFDATGWEVVAVNLSNLGGTTDMQSQLVGEYTPTAPVPEPATILLLSTGLLGFAGVGRKRLKNK